MIVAENLKVLNQQLKDLIVRQILSQVQTPAQYVGGELNSVRKDHRAVRGRLCLAFPDAYTIGMSNHGLQVLYQVMNRRDDWACERVFAPWDDLRRLLAERNVPLFSLETFTPLGEFDVLGFTLQHELAATNVLVILDAAGIPLLAADRTMQHPLVIAGGPSVSNPEPISRFVDAVVIGDGEEVLPALCDEWLRLKQSGMDRPSALAALAARVQHVYVPQCYRPEYNADGRLVEFRPSAGGVPAVIAPAVVADLDAVPLPTAPVVPNVECVQDRIAIEIMRGCPWHCRFCQSTTTKRPLRFRRVETIVAAALESYRNTGYNEISLLSLSTSDYPQFEELVAQLQATFRPLGVSISVPSLRINDQLRSIGEQLNTDRHSGLTLAPEAALDAMRRRIGKQISNEDLYEGCRRAFESGFQRVKLYFMCGLPGEGPADLDGIVEMAESIARLGKEVTGRWAAVVANVSNFVPKPQTPFQWNAMQTREYFRAAHDRLRGRLRMRSVELKCHDIEASLVEGLLARGDRRLGAAIELAWRSGARFDSWSDHFQPSLWWQALADAGIDVAAALHSPALPDSRLPWDHIGIRQGRDYLDQQRRHAESESAALNCQ
jgi:radical SAM family uncharacterized protein